jgi:hypothetical protein
VNRSPGRDTLSAGARNIEETEVETPKTVALGGRTYIATPEDDMTFDQFAWIQSAADKAGLGHELVGMIAAVMDKAGTTEVPLTEKEAEEFTQTIVSRCYRDRAHLDVLAGILVEKGKSWNYEEALKTKEFLGKMKGRADIEMANVVLAQAILGFFWSGLVSMKNSPNSLLLRDVVERLEREEMEQEKMESESGPVNDLETSGS